MKIKKAKQDIYLIITSHFEFVKILPSLFKVMCDIHTQMYKNKTF